MLLLLGETEGEQVRVVCERDRKRARERGRFGANKKKRLKKAKVSESLCLRVCNIIK